MNSLVDPGAIEALYAASQAGVRIDLIVRGICCLRPGLPGVSENIKVSSIVDKFLEHSRISYFQNNDQPEVFLASADWMPRNFRRRVEIMFPIEDPRLQSRLIDGILGGGDLSGYHLAHAARADMLRRLGRVDEARDAYERALALAQQEPERRFLQMRLGQL